MMAVLAACAAAAIASTPATGLLTQAHAQETAKAGSKSKGRSVELRRGGYYSYGAEDSTTRSSAYLSPMHDLQSRSGPFDSGFFFDSGLWPHWWNNAPYPN
jgi:hypothetical protein